MSCAMQVVPGELTIVTGVPNSGKSEWIDALLCQLSQQHGWTFAMCSMEKKVRSMASNVILIILVRPHAIRLGSINNLHSCNPR